MTVLAQNLKTIRKKLACTQMAISEVLDIGFRTYIRYEAGERDAPVAVLVKLARLGNISLDRLLTTTLTPEGLKIPDTETTPTNPKKMKVIGGGLEDGRVIFTGLKNDHLITTDELEKKLLTVYRKLNRSNKEKCVVDTEWILNNPKNLEKGKTFRTSRKAQKEKIARRLSQMAKSIKKITLRG